MLYEYAVEPQAIASNWLTCRYLSEKFGFDRARLLALYPAKWLQLAIDSAAQLPDVEKKTVVERLIKLKRDASLKCDNRYDANTKTWLANAVIQQPIVPFRAIVASANPDGYGFVLTTAEVNEDHPLIAAPQDFEVHRSAPSLAAAMSPLLKSANTP